MDSFELNKILGAILGTCSGRGRAQHRRRRDLRARKPAKPGYEIVVPEHRTVAAAGRRAGGRAADRAIAGRQGRRRPRRERRPRNARPATPSTRADAPWSAPICGAWSAGRRLRMPGFNYSAALKAMGGNWTLDDLNHFIANPQGYDPGHQHDLRRHTARRASGPTSSPILNTSSDNPAPLPKAAEAAPARTIAAVELLWSRQRPGRASPRPAAYRPRECEERLRAIGVDVVAIGPKSDIIGRNGHCHGTLDLLGGLPCA